MELTISFVGKQTCNLNPQLVLVYGFTGSFVFGLIILEPHLHIFQLIFLYIQIGTLCKVRFAIPFKIKPDIFPNVGVCKTYLEVLSFRVQTKLAWMYVVQNLNLG